VISNVFVKMSERIYLL